ncbi:MAG: hypothetical protein JWP21_2052, partial [Tardiphaga sp.]|nr:hypothetical protein [Tardiphaga sp.]
MRPSTVAEVMARKQSVTARAFAHAESVDAFGSARTADARYGTIADGPALSGDPWIYAISCAFADYTAMQ